MKSILFLLQQKQNELYRPIHVKVVSAKDFLDVYSRKTDGGMKLKMQPIDPLKEIFSMNIFLNHTG